MKKTLIIVVAILPFFSIFLHHVLATPAGMIPTGLINFEMAYYLAHGREIFETGGNGLTYANSYDPGSPIIYFHWLVWLFGFGIKILHIDPGVEFVVVGLISGVLMSWFTYSLVEEVLPKPDFRNLLFLFIMWGGGLLVFAALLSNLTDGRPLSYDLLRFDPGQGTWFLNWGRNLIFSTEALYHFMVAGIWLNLLRQKWGYAIGIGLALATTHPFSGIQFMSILLVYIGFLIIARRHNISLVYPAVLLTGLFVFLGYYFVYLNSFPSHREVNALWKLNWTLPSSSAILAYLLVGIFATRTILAKRHKLSDADWLFIICFAISFLLVHHHWFIAPHQPLHFTRGYIWTPLAMLALPELQSAFGRLAKGTKPLATSLIITMVMLFLTLDNLGFLYNTWSQVGRSEAYFSKQEKEIYAWLDQNELTGVLLYTNSPSTSYLAATYTEMYPYLGHWSLTPDYYQKLASAKVWMTEGGSPNWMNEIDYLLIEEQTIPPAFDYGRWNLLHRSGDLILFEQEK